MPGAGRAFFHWRGWWIGSGVVRSHQRLRDHDMAAKRNEHERREERGEQDLKHWLPPNAGPLIRRTDVAAGFTAVDEIPANPPGVFVKTQSIQVLTIGEKP